MLGKLVEDFKSSLCAKSLQYNHKDMVDIGYILKYYYKYKTSKTLTSE